MPSTSNVLLLYWLSRDCKIIAQNWYWNRVQQGVTMTLSVFSCHLLWKTGDLRKGFLIIAKKGCSLSIGVQQICLVSVHSCVVDFKGVNAQNLLQGQEAQCSFFLISGIQLTKENDLPVRGLHNVVLPEA